MSKLHSGKTSFYMLVFFTKILVNKTIFLKNVPIAKQNSAERHQNLVFCRRAHTRTYIYFSALGDSGRDAKIQVQKSIHNSVPFGISIWG